jgi:hypothetical protein
MTVGEVPATAMGTEIHPEKVGAVTTEALNAI